MTPAKSDITTVSNECIQHLVMKHDSKERSPNYSPQANAGS